MRLDLLSVICGFILFFLLTTTAGVVVSGEAFLVSDWAAWAVLALAVKAVHYYT